MRYPVLLVALVLAFAAITGLGSAAALAGVLRRLPIAPAPAWSQDPIFQRRDFIYSSEIGSWPMEDGRFDGQRALNWNGTCPACPRLIREARIPVIRWMTWDRFTDMGGDLPREQFDNVIDGILGVGAYPFIKLQPGFSRFCQTDNLPWYKEIVRQAGPRVRLYESTNEMDWQCGFDASVAGIATGQHWINNMPALKKYARSLGFEIIVGGPAMTNISGLSDGSTVQDPFIGPAVDFLQTIKDEYDRTGDPDLIPAFYSFHAYAADCAGNGHTTLDCVDYYGAYVDAVRREINRIWGPRIGPAIKIAVTEWNLAQGSDHPGWRTDELPAFYRKMLGMFRRHDVWLADVFLITGNDDPLDLIDRQGRPRPSYYAFRDVSADDPLVNREGRLP